jgi:hypothetical protein
MFQSLEKGFAFIFTSRIGPFRQFSEGSDRVESPEMERP